MNKLKKFFLLAAAVFMLFSITACTKEDVETVSQIVDILLEDTSNTSTVEEETVISDEIIVTEGIDESGETSIFEDTSLSEDNSEEGIFSEASIEEPKVEDDYVSYYFRSKKLLNQHYEKHGIDMGFSDAKSYEKAASDVINNPNALTKTEKEDGDYIFYIEETNEFVVLSVDGYIRTYFLPDSGKKYYDKQ